MHDPNLTTDPERSTVRRNGTVNHHRPGRSWQLHIANQYAGSQVETMVIDGNAVAVLTETGEIIHDQPFDTNSHYQTATLTTRKACVETYVNYVSTHYTHENLTMRHKPPRIAVFSPRPRCTFHAT